MSVRGVGMVLCLLAALIAAAQVQPASAQFMQQMHGSMERMDRQMVKAPMNGNVDHDFASMMIRIIRVQSIWRKPSWFTERTR